MTNTLQDERITIRGGSWSTVGRRFGLAALAGAGVNLLIFLLAMVLDVELMVPESPGSDAMVDLGAGVVIMFSILPLVVATGLAVALGRLASGGRIFTAIVAIGLLVSFAPLLSSDMSTGTSITLALMHPVVAAAALWQLSAIAYASHGERS